MATGDAVVCTYVLLAGLPGTGKSTLAKALIAQLQKLGQRGVILNKDDVRAALFPGEATDYSEQQNALSIDAMLAAAGYLRSRPDCPRYILFDGRTFSRAEQIDHVVAAAQAADSRGDWRILHLICSDEVAERRLGASEAHPAANRNFQLYLSLKKKFEPIERAHLLLDMTLPIEESVQSSLAYLGATPEANEYASNAR